jgi:hypothetical protein
MIYQPSTSYAGAYSIEAWAMPGSASKTYQTVFDTRAQDGEYSFDMSVDGSDDAGGQQLHIDVGDGQNWLTNADGGYNVPFAFKAGHWYYIVATVSPARHVAILYVNGRVLGKTSLADSRRLPLLFDPNHPMVIGGDPRYDLISGNPLPGNFDGTIGQVAVYESVLSPAEVAAHYEAGNDALYKAPVISTGWLPAGVESQPYRATVKASYGTGPYSWTVTASKLPPGLVLSRAGVIHGAPTRAGHFSLTLKVTDSALQSASKTLSITIAPIAVRTSLLRPGVVGRSYSARLAAYGGKAPLSWKIGSGGLPPGLKLSRSGAISGTPINSGEYSFTVRVTDARRHSADQKLRIMVRR